MKEGLEKVTEKLFNMGLVPARIWEHKLLGVYPTRRLKTRRQVAKMLGRKKTASLDRCLPRLRMWSWSMSWPWSTTFDWVESCLGGKMGGRYTEMLRRLIL